ncbi:MAG: zinc ribbon domain-containing protein [Syntrophobacteraceae bacterium]
MLEQLKLLIRIQILEDKKSHLIRSKEETPRKISELENELGRFESDYLQKKTEYDQLLKTRRTLEQEIADLNGKMTRSKQRMNDVKNNKEYQALLKEADEVKKEISQREESILEAMDRIETLVGEVQASEQVLEEYRKKFEEEKGVLLAEGKVVTDELSRLDGLQQEVRVNLGPEILKRCDYLLEKRGGVAVAAVQNGTCQVCHMNIPPQKYIELQRDNNIMQCPHCYRYIYWPGHEAYQEVFKEYRDE